MQKFRDLEARVSILESNPGRVISDTDPCDEIQQIGFSFCQKDQMNVWSFLLGSVVLQLNDSELRMKKMRTRSRWRILYFEREK